MNIPPALVITGPTATGKTAVALACAAALDGEIVSADSRQVYHGLDIGTAKPTAGEQASIRHHCLSHVPLHERYTAGAFFRDASEAIRDITGRAKMVIVAGGSGLYVRVLSRGIFDSVETGDPAFRLALERELKVKGAETLFEELQRRDPEAARFVPKTNYPRLIRALEVCRATDRPYSQIRRERLISAPVRAMLFGIHWPRAVLYSRIDARVDAMLAAGLVDEVRAALAAGADPSWTSMNAVGIKEVVAHLQGDMPEGVMVEKIKQHTRNFAKRQMTWFRAETGMRWFDAQSDEDIPSVADRILREFRTHERTSS